MEWGKHVIRLCNIGNVGDSFHASNFRGSELVWSQLGVLNELPWRAWRKVQFFRKYEILPIEDFKDCGEVDFSDKTVVDYLGFYKAGNSN